MKVKIKPHSTLHKFFPQKEFYADLNHYQDLLSYLNSMFPKLHQYTKQLAADNFSELVLFLDKDLKPITMSDFMVKKFKEGDEIYVVPGIKGAKKVAKIIIGIALIAAAGFIAGPAVLGFTAGTTAFATATTIITVVGTTLLTMGVMELMMPVTPTPDTGTAAESAMFASLTNTTAAGITTSLHYGQVRVAGQLLSGYTTPIPHGPDEVIRLEDYIAIPSTEQAEEYNWLLPVGGN